jgi:ParB family chromosome partitioning protein
MPPKSSLGKGLGAMFPDLLNDISARPSFIMCGIEELTPNRFQSRKEFSDQEQKRLVTSIKKNGIIQPIVVRRSGSAYEIIAGERRWRAAQEAGLKEVPIIVRDAEDSQAAELSLIENVQREGLNSLDEAEAYRTLMTKFGLSQEELSARVGKDRSTIANTIRLLKLPAEIKKALIDKTISSGHARALLMLDTPGEQIKVLNIILKKTLSVRETESLIQRLKKKPAKKKCRKKGSCSS